MITKRLRSSWHATAVAYLALFFALGGTAYAAAKWTGEDIADGSLTGADVAADSLTGDDIAPGSIEGADLAPGTVVPGDSTAVNAATLFVTEETSWYRGTRSVDGTEQPAPPAGPVIGVIPGVGELFVAGCEPFMPNNGNMFIGLRNTSGVTLHGVWGYGAEVFDIETPQFEHDLPVGVEAVIAENDARNNILIVAGDGEDPSVTHLMIQAQRYEGQGCRFTAWWSQP